MLSRDKILRETSPLSIFFVKSGSGGNRLLFRYPYTENFTNEQQNYGQVNEQFYNNSVTEQDCLPLKNIISQNDKVLCNMFSVNPNLCGKKFEIKINRVRHVGYPNKINYNANQGDITSFNIVFALRATANYDIVDCYYDLSKRLAIALSFEENRVAYLSNEIKTILAIFDEREVTTNSTTNQKAEEIFSLILSRSSLAKDLKRIFDSLSITGVVDIRINNWISVSFCLPQKVHRLKLITHKSMPPIGTKDIKRCLFYLRPYHGLLLLHEPQELLDLLPIDASPAFIQLIKVTKPIKNFMELSIDANLSLMQIFCLVSQLIYWAKATIIYPICDSNIYAIHPLASTNIRSELVYDFQAKFPESRSLHHYLAKFSEGISLSQLDGPMLNIDEKLNLLSIVTWLLQKRVLIQIHKYLFLMEEPEQNTSTERCFTTTATNQPQLHLQQQQPEENSNFGLSLSSTPSSSLEYPSPSNGLSLSSDCPLVDSGSSIMTALQRAGLTQAIAKNVMIGPSSKDPEDLKLLVRILPYLDGKHHIENIMFFENLERSDVLILCDKFRDIIFTCHYEDVAVSQLSPFDSIR